jgi:hypothetical protein
MVEKEILKQRILELEKENESLKKQLKEMKDHRSFIEGKENFKHISENGEFVSEFSSEKVSYFLQRFGAKK